MIIRRVIEQIRHRSRRGLVFAAGGSADIIFAKMIAAGLIGEGCPQRRELKLMNKRLLREALLFLNMVNR